MPTVTDANVVLGIIDPDYFLGGKIKLDRGKAEAAISRIAKQLKLEACWTRPTRSTPPAITT